MLWSMPCLAFILPRIKTYYNFRISFVLFWHFFFIISLFLPCFLFDSIWFIFSHFCFVFYLFFVFVVKSKKIVSIWFLSFIQFIIIISLIPSFLQIGSEVGLLIWYLRTLLIFIFNNSLLTFSHQIWNIMWFFVWNFQLTENYQNGAINSTEFVRFGMHVHTQSIDGNAQMRKPISNVDRKTVEMSKATSSSHGGQTFSGWLRRIKRSHPSILIFPGFSMTMSMGFSALLPHRSRACVCAFSMPAIAYNSFQKRILWIEPKK